MSAFAVVYEPSNKLVDPDVLERVMERLIHRGPDGHDAILVEHALMGHWHFWTTPEEVGEKQPLELTGLPFKIVLDGRLDNRPELLSELSINPPEGQFLSDAALILRAYVCWGEQCFTHLIGEFALAILDQQQSKLVCARDSLGDRTLFYSVKGTRLVVASEPFAVASADGSTPELNESAVAQYFAMQISEDGQTLFKGVYELLPAYGMAFNASGQRTWCYWQPAPSFRLRGRSDEEYAEQFRILLEQSVRCRLRSITPVGVLMSGGLDSTSVACLTARILKPQPLTTVSYVFNELTDCDERRYIEAVKEQWDIHSIQIACDDAWPLRDWQNWPRNPNQPEGNPYRLLKERAYQRAHEEGLRVLLTGGFGDHLYDAEIDFLADLIMDARYLEAGRELILHIRYAGLRWTWQAGYLQRFARRVLDLIPGGKHLHRRPHLPPVWLTSFAKRRLSKPGKDFDSAAEWNGNLLGLSAANSSAGEIYNASRHMLELRHPYRDRRLVEYILTLPAYQLYSHGLFKYVLRVGMRGILPEPIRTRVQPTSLLSFYYRGIEREKTVFLSCIRDVEAAWQEYIRTDWLDKHWNTLIMPGQHGSGTNLPWLFVSFLAWYQSCHFN